MKIIQSGIARKSAPHVIILLAFFLQLSYLAELGQSFPQIFGQQPFCGVDAKAHAERAIGLLDGSLPGDAPYPFIPLYPYYLAILSHMFGTSLLLPVFIQALLQLVGLAALYRIGRLHVNAWTGILAALGMATYSYYLFYLPCFDQSLLTVPFFTLGVLFLLQFYYDRKDLRILAAGISLALAVLSRPTILALFSVIVIWLFYTIQKSKATVRVVIRYAALLILPSIIVVAPITWHNYQTSGRFLLLTEYFDVNLFTGNNPDAAGLDSLAHVQSQPAVVRFKSLYTQVEAGEVTLEAEVIRYIREQPRDWLALTVTKVWLWFGEVDERLVSPFFPLSVDRSRVLAPLLIEWRALFIVALLGLVMVPIRARQPTFLIWLIYGVFSLVTIVFFIQLRFRLPFAPLVFIYAASLLAAAPTLRPSYPRRFWITLALLLVADLIVPTLWLFVLIFAAAGLWPNQASLSHGRLNRRFGLSLGLIGIYLLGAGLWNRVIYPTASASQTIDHYFGPSLVGQGILGQTFAVSCDNLNRIDVTLGVFENSRHDQPVTFYLASDLSGQEIVYSESFEGSQIRDYQRKSFTFAPLPASAGRTFFFFISSPTSTPQNALTARGYTDRPLDRYPAGSAYAGRLGELQQFEADFAFAAYCDLNVWQRLWRLRD